jgi:hypothetical protein
MKQNYMKQSVLLFIAFIIITIGYSQQLKNTTRDSPLIGAYTGGFGSKQIILFIDVVTEDSIGGSSMVAGGSRNFKGTYTLNNGTYSVIVKEPGDNKFDGVFAFSFNTNKPDIITGNWKPNTASVAAKMYILQRKPFSYQKDLGMYSQGSERELVDDDVNNIPPADLEIMRNEIYARHGLCFKGKYLKSYFEQEQWYVPASVDVRDQLTPIEKKNIALIKKFEKYDKDHNEDFGR